jgi:hypothetical protein
VLAGPLRPVHAPWYVRHPVPAGIERQFPADGWYWVPSGHHVAIYLGSNYEIAAHELRLLVKQAEADESPAHT